MHFRVSRDIRFETEGEIMNTFRLARVAIGIAILFAGHSLAADPATVNWNSVPTKTVTLFYPAQSTINGYGAPLIRALRLSPMGEPV
jgi:hypothetical protein